MVTSHNDEIVLWMGMGKYNMTKQPKALRLADELPMPIFAPEAAELRRLHEVNQTLLGTLKEIVDAADGDGWNSLDAGFSKARAAIEKAGEA